MIKVDTNIHTVATVPILHFEHGLKYFREKSQCRKLEIVVDKRLKYF
jgi:hypothetical protein